MNQLCEICGHQHENVVTCPPPGADVEPCRSAHYARCACGGVAPPPVEATTLRFIDQQYRTSNQPFRCEICGCYAMAEIQSGKTKICLAHYVRMIRAGVKV
jgi:hypothetical protein